ncbi:hypothetical protein BJ166DRAFT_624793 [Pestalotiopsis sp. NC0098]|nr:hypothetical protein BJ166DRAFT_624793 [Pestalotiopsis sp. NC0098]
MKTLRLLSSTILLSSRTVLAEWSIVNMSASATPHGSQSHFSLTFEGPDMMATCSGTANSYQTLGSLPETACEPDSVSFSWTQIGPGDGDGAFLQVRAVIKGWTTQRASHKIPKSEIEWSNELPNPNGRIQVYVGPPNFDLSPINGTDDGGPGYGGDNGDSCERT